VAPAAGVPFPVAQPAVWGPFSPLPAAHPGAPALGEGTLPPSLGLQTPSHDSPLLHADC
jgi:hypothetical protein